METGNKASVFAFSQNAEPFTHHAVTGQKPNTINQWIRKWHVSLQLQQRSVVVLQKPGMHFAVFACDLERHGYSQTWTHYSMCRGSCSIVQGTPPHTCSYLPCGRSQPCTSGTRPCCCIRSSECRCTLRAAERARRTITDVMLAMGENATQELTSKRPQKECKERQRRKLGT